MDGMILLGVVVGWLGVWNSSCQEVKDVDVGFMCIKEGLMCLTYPGRRGLSTQMCGRSASVADKRS